MWNKLCNKLIWIIAILSMLSILLWITESKAEASNQPELRTIEQLQKDKLEQEKIKLELENKKLNSSLEKFISLTPFIAGIVALFSLIISFWKYHVDNNRQRDLDREQKEKDNLRRFDEQFAAVVTNLGSEKEAIKAGAAVSIRSFLKPEYKLFHEQVFMILLANLKLDHNDVINDILIEGFEKAIRFQLEYFKDKNEKFLINLSDANLYQIDLAGLNLSEGDMGFAYLRGANLTETILFRVRGLEANLEKAVLYKANLNEARFRKARFQEARFHEANLVAADLRKANLTNAEFHQAKMQSAHLDNAKLFGAKFPQANINDTFFKDCSFDEVALKSILKAYNWQKAHFDEAIMAKLIELSNSQGSTKK
ncbi:MAG: pentapeptide repeat-containing protein [Desulfobaccales bacterium]